MTIVIVGASYATSSVLALELGRSLGTTARPAGIVGATLERWSAAAPWRELVPLETALVLELGGNGEVTSAGVLEAHAKLEADFASVVWALPPVWPVPGPVSARRAAARAAIIAAGVPTVDGSVRLSSSDLARDGVHLTARGYAELGRALGRELARNGRVSRILRGASIAIAACVAAISIAFIAQKGGVM